MAVCLMAVATLAQNPTAAPVPAVAPAKPPAQSQPAAQTNNAFLDKAPARHCSTARLGRPADVSPAAVPSPRRSAVLPLGSC